ncbi:rCG48820 [Rattus norvegicus]|uniref:RCG48820 n=1 Tax=Rattus norvegicus TaxID=10116 RepID=A6IG87_RAT|nr:rCG48820 [Rattus norvegicus]
MGWLASPRDPLASVSLSWKKKDHHAQRFTCVLWTRNSCFSSKPFVEWAITLVLPPAEMF